MRPDGNPTGGFVYSKRPKGKKEHGCGDPSKFARRFKHLYTVTAKNLGEGKGKRFNTINERSPGPAEFLAGEEQGFIL